MAISLFSNVYNNDTSKHNYVSENTSMNYVPKNSNSFSLSASSSRGKSITIKGLQSGVKLTFIYTPSSNTLSITCG